ncbi:hypothetical protein M405DRAFT_749833, partial [Rhizopogon salebrosus TDB-379]
NSGDRRDAELSRAAARLRDVEAERSLSEKQARLGDEAEQEELSRQQEKSEEERIQQKLRNLGVCGQDYHWIKQSSGYRCAGGSHFVSDSKLL